MSPDGETLLIVNAASTDDLNLATLAIGKDATVKPLLDRPEQVSEPSLSPNGQWMLYYEFTRAPGLPARCGDQHPPVS